MVLNMDDTDAENFNQFAQRIWGKGINDARN